MKISTEERERLLRQIEEPSSMVGTQVPDMIIWNGKEIRLRNEIWELNHSRSEGEKRKKELLELLNNLIEKNINRIRNGDITAEEGEEIVRETVGLKRAIDNLQGRDYEIEDEESREINDQKRWLKLIKRIKE